MYLLKQHELFFLRIEERFDLLFQHILILVYETFHITLNSNILIYNSPINKYVEKTH